MSNYADRLREYLITFFRIMPKRAQAVGSLLNRKIELDRRLKKRGNWDIEID